MSSSPVETALKPERLFFALWPNDEVRQSLRQHCKALLRHRGGRPVAPEHWHMTLAFLGRVTASQRACVEQLAVGIRLPHFELQLDHVGHWAQARVLWVGASKPPATLCTLATGLAQGSRECGLALDTRPFVNHLTIKRKLHHPPPDKAIKPVLWPVWDFVLVRSCSLPEGAHYTVVGRWPLAETEPVSGHPGHCA